MKKSRKISKYTSLMLVGLISFLSFLNIIQHTYAANVKKKPDNISPVRVHVIPKGAWADVANKVKKTPDILPEIMKTQYAVLMDTGASPSLRSQALSTFIKLKTTWVCREALLLDNSDMVIMSAKYLVKEKDPASIPFFAEAIRKNNYLKMGSEEATLHTIKLNMLITSAYAITSLTHKVDKTDSAYKTKVEQVAKELDTWAKRKGITFPKWHEKKPKMPSADSEKKTVQKKP